MTIDDKELEDIGYIEKPQEIKVEFDNDSKNGNGKKPKEIVHKYSGKGQGQLRESVDQELWILYRKETNTFKKSLILEKIVELQNFMTAFYDSAQYVTQQSALLTKKKRMEQEESITN